MNRRALGARGEVLAGDWYAERGYTVLDRNWRCRQGELDLVLERDGVVVFCEVKTRTSDAFGIGAEAVDPREAAADPAPGRRVARRAHDRRARELRFDVVSILAPRDAAADPRGARSRVLSGVGSLACRRAQRRCASRCQQPVCQWRRSSGAS